MPKADRLLIAEVELGQIAVQMALAAVLIDALHAALEDRIEALNGVGRDNLVTLTAHVLVFRMVHGVMAGKLGADLGDTKSPDPS